MLSTKQRRARARRNDASKKYRLDISKGVRTSPPGDDPSVRSAIRDAPKVSKTKVSSSIEVVGRAFCSACNRRRSGCRMFPQDRRAPVALCPGCRQASGLAA